MTGAATRYFWSGLCPVCGVGRLLVFKDLSAHSLYLHCEECEWGWRDPERSNSSASGFLTLDEDFEAEVATELEIRKHGWSKLALKVFVE